MSKSDYPFVSAVVTGLAACSTMPPVTLNRLRPYIAVRPKRSIFAVLVVLCLSACASENTPQSAEIAPDRADAFAAADNDQDDKLSQGEAGDFVVYKVFEVYDTDEDGLLTLAEWSRSNSGETSDFEKRDANRDGVVTLGEAIVYGRHSGGGASLMRKADKNRDGKLDRSEIQ